MRRHRSQLLVTRFNHTSCHRFALFSNVAHLSFGTVWPEQTHIQPLQVDPGEEGEDQHAGHIVKHPLGEVDAGRVREGGLIQTLERKVYTRADNGANTAQC